MTLSSYIDNGAGSVGTPRPGLAHRPGHERAFRDTVNSRKLSLGSCLAALVLLFLAQGCSTTDPNIPKTDSLAALIVEKANAESIRQAARSVFYEDHFVQGQTNETQMAFEKRGSMLNDIAYGSFMNNEAWIRVKLTIKPLEENKHLLECNAFVVRDYGEAFFEEENKIHRFKRGHYQEILLRIQAQAQELTVKAEGIDMSEP